MPPPTEPDAAPPTEPHAATTPLRRVDRVQRVAGGTRTGTQHYPEWESERHLDPQQSRPPNSAGGEAVKFWQRLGYPSLQAFLDERERLNNAGLPVDLRNAERRLFGLAPLPETELRAEVDRERRGQTKQIGLKLARSDYERLVAVAESHDVAPTTMARMLLKRSLGAVATELRELR